MNDQAFTDLIEDIVSIMPGFKILNNGHEAFDCVDNTGEIHRVTVGFDDYADQRNRDDDPDEQIGDDPTAGYVVTETGTIRRVG